MQLVGLLSLKGVRAKLIQSDEGFKLYNLVEIRSFLKYIGEKNMNKSPVIDNDLWNKAKKRLKKVYGKSACLPNCLRYLSTRVNGRSVPVDRFSKAFFENLEQLETKGYKLVRASIGFIVAWKGEKDESETAVILPMLYFRQS